MKKKINGKMLVGYFILGGMGVFLIFLMAVGRQKQSKNYDVNLTPEQNSVYTSKLEALRDKMKGSPKPARGYESAIQSPATTSLTTSSDTKAAPDPVPSHAKPAKAIQASEELIQAQQQAQQIVRRNVRQEIPNEEYQQLENDIKNVYQNTPKQPTGKKESQPPMSDKERRKAMMEQSWGQVGSEDQTPTDASRNFTGVIHQTQTVRSGSVALLRTTQPIPVGNVVIPENTLLSGVVSIGRERLTITINSVRLDKRIVPIHLAVYGTDGIAGIPIKADDVGRELNSETTEEVVRQVGNTVSRTGGIGRAIGSIFSGTARAVKREKERDVLLIDNQMIIFRIN